MKLKFDSGLEYQLEAIKNVPFTIGTKTLELL